MATVLLRSRRRSSAMEHPVELRFVDMLLIIIAVMVIASVISIRTGKGSNTTDLTIVTQRVPAALARKQYWVSLSARGGDGAYRWHLRGPLPAGLTFQEREGAITGRTAQIGSTRVWISVTAGRATTPEKPIVVQVVPSGKQAVDPPKPWIDSQLTLFRIKQGADFTHSFTLQNGTQPISWQGSPPGWLVLSPAGDLTTVGEPPPGDTTFTVSATDADGRTATQAVQISVAKRDDSLFWRILKWLQLIAIWISCLFFLLRISLGVKWLLFGRPPGVDPGSTGLLNSRRRKRRI